MGLRLQSLLSGLGTTHGISRPSFSVPNSLTSAFKSWYSSTTNNKSNDTSKLSNRINNNSFAILTQGSDPTIQTLRSYSSGIEWHGTTILSVRKGNSVSVVGDGQVSMGSVIVKANARKVRRIGANSDVIAGFAGTTSDAMTLLERLETKIEEHPGQLLRACVNLAKDWRMDKYLRRLDALMLVSDKDLSLTLTGNGDVLETADGIVGIGSGGTFAIAAARALLPIEGYDSETIALRSMEIASDLCCYTNRNFTVETILTSEGEREKSKS
eukprot:CAMPEP_0184700222 /NCGR_PEP_ID=MMETSP0313-20130426/10593_1 /TAXON_ID=2792 /ORGANISM="Porphyridium aerugineum, Strain SAG 1380-2" /LENGTH=269 /DNA_ID=CAMNT_0027159769 /DNA_START=75 /DNA_END=884 /DNA_ORIENTATION=+